MFAPTFSWQRPLHFAQYFGRSSSDCPLHSLCFHPMTSCSPFIPGGSDQESSTDIAVTLSATCINLSGASMNSSLTYDLNQLEGVNEIANLNGVLPLVSGSGTPENVGNEVLPAGSYQNSSSNISVILKASCQKLNVDYVPSGLTYSVTQAAGLINIMNENGILTSVF